VRFVQQTKIAGQMRDKITEFVQKAHLDVTDQAGSNGINKKYKRGAYYGKRVC
jgi:hypothetical protein